MIKCYYIKVMKSKQAETVDIFTFFDYREYLKAVYTTRKKNEKGFSHRFFSREAGISSPNYLIRVLKGERTLNGEYIEKFSKALNLTSSQNRYFKTLVQFNNATNFRDKESALKTLLSLRYRRGIHKLNDRKLQFFSKWYYPVIRELAVILNAKDDYNLLARNCIPRITSRQAADAVAYLLKNGFLAKDDSDNYQRTNPVITSGDEVKSMVLRTYHKQVLSQSVDALDTIEKSNRDISSLTLSVSRKTYFTMKKEIQIFRKRLLNMAKEDPNPELVCLAGFQLFPRSRINSKKKRVS